MKNAGIICGIHYDALHLNPVYQDLNLAKRYRTYLKSKKISNRTVSLPMNEKLSFLELEYIIDKVNKLI